MASSPLTSSCVFSLVLAWGPVCAAQEAGNARQEIVLESGPLAFDAQANVFEIQSPRIRQGDLYIAADKALATGIEFDESSEWRFSGNVRIEAGTTVLQADSAVFEFADAQLSRGELEGTPASLSEVGAISNATIVGRAQKMSYDYVARTLHMTGNVWMQKDKTEMQACEIVYDFAAERITSDCADGIRMRLVPASDERAPASDALQ